ncbi:MAG: hypothetical protein ACYS9X_03550 [Planctomycetota bacterium]
MLQSKRLTLAVVVTLVGLIGGRAFAQDVLFAPPEDDAATPLGPSSEDGGEGRGFDWAPGTGETAGDRGRLGIRGGFYIPTGDYQAGPEAAVFWQKPMGKTTVELSLGYARVAADDGSASSSLWIGSAGALWTFTGDEERRGYVMAGLGGHSESSESALSSDSALLSSIDLGVGMVTGKCLDIRTGMSIFTNSDNVSSAAFLTVGVIY